MTAALAAAWTPACLAQAAETQPIKIIIPFPPGGSNDVIGRVIAAQLSNELKQTIVIDNRGGASGTIGTTAVVRAQPDGLTLLFMSSSISTNSAVNKKLPYDVMRDLAPVARVGAGHLVLLVNRKLPVETFEELVRYSKKTRLNYGTAGAGGYQHLATELINTRSGLQATHIPYRGNGPAFTDLIGGELSLMLATLESALPLIKAGQVKALAVTGRTRSKPLPDVPTLAEAGLPGVVLEGWWGFFAPARTPRPVIDRLHAGVAAAMANPAIVERFTREGTLPVVGTPDQLGEMMAAEVTLWQNVVRDARIQVE